MSREKPQPEMQTPLKANATNTATKDRSSDTVAIARTTSIDVSPVARPEFTADSEEEMAFVQPKEEDMHESLAEKRERLKEANKSVVREWEQREWAKARARADAAAQRVAEFEASGAESLAEQTRRMLREAAEAKEEPSAVAMQAAQPSSMAREPSSMAGAGCLTAPS